MNEPQKHMQLPSKWTGKKFIARCFCGWKSEPKEHSADIQTEWEQHLQEAKREERGEATQS